MKTLLKLVKDVYESSGVNSVMTFLRYNQDCIEAILDYTDDICGINNNRLAQRVWHFIHQTTEVPTHENGIIYGFGGLDVGYSANIPANYKFSPSIMPDDILIPLLRYGYTEGIHGRTLKYQNVINLLSKHTSFLDPINPTMKERAEYFRAGLTEIHMCDVCGELCKTPILDSNRIVCSAKCANHESYNKMSDDDKLEFITRYFYSSANRIKFSLSRIASEYKPIHQFIMNNSDYLPDTSSMIQRIYHVVHGLDNAPICQHCGDSLVNKFNRYTVTYPITCSKKCNNKFKDNIAKRLKNNGTNSYGYRINRGKNESQLLDAYENEFKIKLDRHTQISKYFPDGICENDRIIVEVNESYHMNSKQFEKDLQKYQTYISMGYAVHIIWDCVTKSHIEKSIYYSALLDQLFSYNINTSIFVNNSQILTDDGYVTYNGVTKKTSDSMIDIILEDGKTLSCTGEHLVFINENEYLMTKYLQMGSIIQTIDGTSSVISLNKREGEFEVFDIINSGSNNRFYANGILVHNCLIIDEAAFVPPNIMDEFIQSVLPIVSSRPDSKIIVVSTPNGTGNWYSETYHKALYNIGEDGWKSFRIDWWDVPGRDEDWKRKKIAEFNGDLRKFAQEYGNNFLGSSQTLISGRVIEKLKKESDNYADPEIYDINSWQTKVWYKPRKKRTYIIGCDIAEGVGGDFSTAIILDVTDTSRIQVCATFADNTISPTDFAYVLAKLAHKYNNALIAGERNGVGRSTMDTIWNVYEMENVLCWKGKNEPMIQPGIFSHNTIKVEACIWAKFVIESEIVNIEFNDKNILFEMEYFEKKANSTRSVYQAVEGKHDDYFMALIWALWLIEPTVADYNFVVESVTKTQTGIPVPRIIRSDSIMNDEYYINDKADDVAFDIDEIYNRMRGSKKPQQEVNESDIEFDLNDEIGFLDDIPDEYDDSMSTEWM